MKRSCPVRMRIVDIDGAEIHCPVGTSNNGCRRVPKGVRRVYGRALTGFDDQPQPCPHSDFGQGNARGIDQIVGQRDPNSRGKMTRRWPCALPW